jgi:hypothetical protein
VDEGPAIMIKMSRLEFAPSLQRYVPCPPGVGPCSSTTSRANRSPRSWPMPAGAASQPCGWDTSSYMPPERGNDPVIQDPHRVVRCRAAPHVLWAQHHCGIWRSTDSGLAWQSVEAAKPSAFRICGRGRPERSAAGLVRSGRLRLGADPGRRGTRGQPHLGRWSVFRGPAEGTASAGRLPPRISACAGGQPGWAPACDGLDDRLAVGLGKPGTDLDSGQRRAAARLRPALDIRRIERAARSNLGEALPGGRSQYVP